jgi:site-specific DNA-methyltransferase (adenine-specific)
MSIYYQRFGVTVHHDDALSVLAGMPKDSVHTIATDPPHNLGFMGQSWDRPGSAARGYKTDGDLAVNPYGRARVEYGGTAYRQDPAELGQRYEDWCRQWASEALRVLVPGGHLAAFGGTRTAHRLACGLEKAGLELRDQIAWLYGGGFPKSHDVAAAITRTSGEAAAEPWRGWGTALRPSHEPIILARKPLAGTVAQNAQTYGAGGLNINDCRVEPTGESRPRTDEPSQDTRYTDRGGTNLAALPGVRGGSDSGRWPANVALDTDAATELDEQIGTRTSGAHSGRRTSNKFATCYGTFTGTSTDETPREKNSGGASRFFPVFYYEPKAPPAERPQVGGTAHPTVKPVSLLRWLLRLLTSPGGLVVDPFLGSGTTALAARAEGMRCIGVENEQSYLPLITDRLDGYRATRGTAGQADLLNDLCTEGVTAA